MVCGALAAEVAPRRYETSIRSRSQGPPKTFLLALVGVVIVVIVGTRRWPARGRVGSPRRMGGGLALRWRSKPDDAAHR